MLKINGGITIGMKSIKCITKLKLSSQYRKTVKMETIHKSGKTHENTDTLSKIRFNKINKREYEKEY